MVQPVNAPFRHNLDSAEHARAFMVRSAGGLNVQVDAGRVRIDQTVTNFASATTLAMANNNTNYVFISSGSAITSNTTGYPANSVPLARVVTAAGAITSVIDDRCFFYEDTAAGDGGGAPTGAQYLVLALDGTLTAERRFVPGTALSAVDSGANADYTLNHAQVATGDLHQDYLLASGARTLTGNLAVSGGVTIDGVDVGSHVHSGGAGDGAQIPHANLTGLTGTDHHTQYALLAGRAGGQTLIGGTTASENLALQSTAHATKGKITSDSALRFTGSGANARIEDSAGTPHLSVATSAPLNTLDGSTRITDYIEMTSVALPAGNAGFARLANVSDVLYVVYRQSVATLEVPLGTTTGFVGYIHHAGWLVVDTGAVTPFLSDFGSLSGINAVVGTVARTSDATGLYINVLSGAVSGVSTAVIEQTNALSRPEQQWWHLLKWRLTTATSVRFFVGWTNQSAATMLGTALGSPGPAGQWFGLSFDTTIGGEANFQWIRKNAAGTVTKASTGIAADTSVHLMRLRVAFSGDPGGGALISQLLTSAFAVQSTQAAISSLPDGSINTRFVIALRTETGAGRAFDYYYGYMSGSLTPSG